jgi:hypothetical protein
MRLSAKLIAGAAAAVLSIGAAAPALGGSVTRPGDTIGLAVGLPLPQGFYFANTVTYERRNTSPDDTRLPSMPHLGLVDPLDDFWRTSATDLGAFGPD